MDLAQWLAREVIFFGGKGGVGKTTSAAATALLAADTGRRTLLVSTDPAHSTADILHQPLGPEETPVGPNLWAVEIDPEREARAYIERVRQHLMRVVGPHLRDEIERQIEIARVSPGAEEAALFDRIADLLERIGGRYDLVIFDTAPTGHTLRLLSLPELMEAWVDGLLERRRKLNALTALWHNMTVGGAPGDREKDPVERVLDERRRKFARVRRILLDDERTAFWFVLNPERLPILETRKAVELLRHHGIPVGGLIVNRVLPPETDDHPFLTARKQQEAAYLKEIERLFPDLPRITVPLLPHDVAGRDGLRQVARYLSAVTMPGAGSVY